VRSQNVSPIVSVEAMEALIIILCGVLIVGVVWELGGYLLKRVEDKREQERRDHWRRRQDR
jgi:hypothetical protein